MPTVHEYLVSIVAIATELSYRSSAELADYMDELKEIEDSLDSVRMAVDDPIE